MKRLNNADILIVTLITLFCLISLFTSELNSNYIKIIVEYLMILFLPGYSILTTLFPRKKELKIGKLLALSFIVSILITLLIGIIFNYIPSEVRLNQIIIYIAIFTLIMQPLSFLRRKDVSKSFNLDLNISKRFKLSFKAKSQRDKIISIASIVFILFAIFTTAYIILSPKEDSKFTEFYILGPDNKAYNYPTNLTTGKTGEVIIGIVNHEHKEASYKMVVLSNDRKISEENITLNDEEKLEIPYNFTVSGTGKKKLEFLLYKLPDDKNVYRYLFLQIDVN